MPFTLAILTRLHQGVSEMAAIKWGRERNGEYLSIQERTKKYKKREWGMNRQLDNGHLDKKKNGGKTGWAGKLAPFFAAQAREERESPALVQGCVPVYRVGEDMRRCGVVTKKNMQDKLNV